jgi:hypothetical protein
MPGVQLLQLLLQHALGTPDEAGASAGCEEAATKTGLQQYVVDVLLHLQEAAAVHEVGACSSSSSSNGSKVAWLCGCWASTSKHAACHATTALVAGGSSACVHACSSSSSSGGSRVAW